MSGLTPFWSVARIVSLLLISYLLGSIPSGYLAGKWIKGIDLRDYGSGTVSGSMVWEHVAKWAVVPVGLLIFSKARWLHGWDCTLDWERLWLHRLGLQLSLVIIGRFT